MIATKEIDITAYILKVVDEMVPAQERISGEQMEVLTELVDGEPGKVIIKITVIRGSEDVQAGA